MSTREGQVGPGPTVLGLFERQVGSGPTVLGIFESQVGPGPTVLVTFERQAGPAPAKIIQIFARRSFVLHLQSNHSSIFISFRFFRKVCEPLKVPRLQAKREVWHFVLKLAPDRRFWALLEVKLALNQRFWAPLPVKMALEWQSCAPLNFKLAVDLQFWPKGQFRAPVGRAVPRGTSAVLEALGPVLGALLSFSGP